MGMGQSLVLMRVPVPSPRDRTLALLLLVVVVVQVVVGVPVIMDRRLVAVRVDVPFGEMQRDAERHQQSGHNQRDCQRLTEGQGRTAPKNGATE